MGVFGKGESSRVRKGWRRGSLEAGVMCSPSHSCDCDCEGDLNVPPPVSQSTRSKNARKNAHTHISPPIRTSNMKPVTSSLGNLLGHSQSVSTIIFVMYWHGGMGGRNG